VFISVFILVPPFSFPLSAQRVHREQLEDNQNHEYKTLRNYLIIMTTIVLYITTRDLRCNKFSFLIIVLYLKEYFCS